MDNTILFRIAIWAVPVLFSIVVHEVSHGYMAFKLGDSTAKMQGRLTLNPLNHVDPIGTVILPAIMLISGGPVFGWAKPVPFNPYNFHRHINIRKGTLLVALAGPLSNFALAFVGSFFLVASVRFFPEIMQIKYLFQAFVFINLYLAFFNLIPIPPLDGSKILMGLLPPDYDHIFLNLERYGFIILMVIIVTGAFRILLIPVELIYNLFTYIPKLIFFAM